MEIIKWLNDALWSGPVLCLILGCGLYLTLGSHFAQVRLLHRALGRLARSMKKKGTGYASLCTALGATVGTDGTLTVIRDLQMKEPYVGSTELITGEIGDDVTAYFAQSEHTPTACALGVLVDRDCSVKVAGGYLLQLLPGAPDDVIDRLESGIKRAGAVTKMLEAGMTPEDILGQVCGDLGVVFMETTEVSYKCYCSRDRVTAALISLGRKELEEIKADGKTFPVECQFCDTVYEFTPADIDELLKKI